MTAVQTPEKTELGKFFQVSVRQLDADQVAPEMFSAAIDAEWHQLLDNPEYAEFCTQSAGRLINHVENTGYGRISWVDVYEEMFGPLPEVWFTDADGLLDERALARYHETGQVWADWDCSPAPGDGDVAPKISALTAG